MISSYKIAVHVHLFYQCMWKDVQKYISNLEGYNYDLFVTMTEENKSLEQKIKKFYPEVRIIYVLNKGYDVWPFLIMLEQINLDDYKYVIKLHTKGIKGVPVVIAKWYITRRLWAKLLWNSLLMNESRVNCNFDHLDNDKSLGMIGSRYLITDDSQNFKHVKQKLISLMKELSISDAPVRFVAGTMFIVRSDLLKFVQHRYKESDFDTLNKSGEDGTLAHVLERLFGTYVVAKGYTIQGFDRDLGFEILSRLLRVWRFFYQDKITRHNKRIIKVLRIPVYIKNYN